MWVIMPILRSQLARNLLLFSALLALSSCYPWHETYFSPSTATESAVPNKCSHRIGARGSILLNLGSATLTAKMDPGAEKLVLFISSIKQDGLTLRHGPVNISSPRGSQSYTPTHFTMVINEPKSQRIEKMPYEHDVRMDAGKFYELVIKNLPIEESYFTVAIPPVLMNDQVVTILPITFTKITEWRMDLVVLNC